MRNEMEGNYSAREAGNERPGCDGLTVGISITVFSAALYHATTWESCSIQHGSFFPAQVTEDNVRQCDVGQKTKAFPWNAEVGAAE